MNIYFHTAADKVLAQASACLMFGRENCFDRMKCVFILGCLS